jgi:hypothetical protein
MSTVTSHFRSSQASVAATYAAILEAAKALGPVTEDPKKTSIHLVRSTAFAGVAAQKAALVLTLKSDRDVASRRIRKREQASANRWHLEVRLQSPDEVDGDVRRWLERAYALAGPKVARTPHVLDTETREIAPPADFVRALKAAPPAWERWQSLSYSHQREHVEAIEEAKKPETRARRIEGAIRMIWRAPTR